MTIVVGVAAPDGLVLAADSRTTVIIETDEDGGPRRTRIASDTAQKVFEIHGRFGVACYGAAFLEEKTIAGAMTEFQAVSTAKTYDELVEELGNFFQDRLLKAWKNLRGADWTPDDGWQLGLLIAGHDKQAVGRLCEVRTPGVDGPVTIDPGLSTAKIGIAARGIDEVVNRLLAGFDSSRLANRGVAVPQEIQEALAGLEYNLLLPISIQDAIDAAVFLIRTTIDMQRFSDGTRGEPGAIPACGGPIRILALGRDGIEWVRGLTLTPGSPPGNAEGALGLC